MDTTPKIKSAIFWSGGKDSALCLDEVLNAGEYEVCYLITTLSETYHRISMHGVREKLLDEQARALGIPLKKMWVKESTNEEYEMKVGELFRELKSKGIHHFIFGDIFLEEIKAYREKLLKQHGVTGIFPLWKKDSELLFKKFLDRKFKAITCCVNTASLDESFVGLELNGSFLKKLPDEVDVCGENGEYHSFVFNGPIFNQTVKFSLGEKVFRPLEIKTTDPSLTASGFWYVDLMPWKT